MNPKSSQDPFDLDYEAVDEFAAAPADDWRASPPTASDEETDPFAPALQAAQAMGGPQIEAGEPARPAVANPVHEMLAGAEAAFGETLLPRITIHIFAAAPETAELADRAAEDRRMERTTVVTRMGGL